MKTSNSVKVIRKQAFPAALQPNCSDGEETLGEPKNHENPPRTPQTSSVKSQAVEFYKHASTTAQPELDCANEHGAETTMTEAERRKLLECEETIRRGWKNFIEAGEALLTIRDQKLYREHYVSFEEYHRRVWQYQKSQVYRLMDAAKVVRVLSPLGEVALPTCEAQVRPLVALLSSDGSKIATTWKQALEEAADRPVTARLVRQYVNAVIPERSRRAPSRTKAPVNTVNKIEDLLTELVELAGNSERRREAEELRVRISGLLPRIQSEARKDDGMPAFESRE